MLLMSAMAFFSVQAQKSAYPLHPNDSIASQYQLEEVIVTPNRNTNTIKNLPAQRIFVSDKTMQRYGLNSVTDLSFIAPNVWIPQYGSKRTTAFYIRGIGSRSGNSSVGVYLDGSPVMYNANVQTSMINLNSMELLSGAQGTLYGRNSLAGTLNFRTISPFHLNKTYASLSFGSHNTFHTDVMVPLFANNKIAVYSFASVNNHNGFFYNRYKHNWADPEKELSAGTKLEWRPTVKDVITVSVYTNDLSQGAFPYRGYDEVNKQLEPLAYNGESMFKRNSLYSLVSYQRKGSLYTLNLSGTFEYLKEKTNMDQDYSPKSIFQMMIDGTSKAGTFDALFKWHDRTYRNNLAVGASLYLDRNQTNNPIEFGVDGIKMMLNPGLAKASSNPKMPFNIASPATESEVINLDYLKPRKGGALYSQYTLNDLFFSGLSLTFGANFGIENYAIDYQVSSAFKFVLTPKDPSSSLKTIALAPKVNMVGNYNHTEMHFSPRVALSYEADKWLSAYVSFAQGYRSGNYNEQAFADFIMKNEQMALMNAMQKKQPDNYPVEENELIFKPEKGTNLELGLKGSLADNRFNWRATAYTTWVENLQVTDFVASGLGRVQENFQKGRYNGVEINLEYAPIRSLVLMANYGFTDASIIMPDKKLNVPYVPKHMVTAGITYNPTLGKNYFIDNFAVSLYGNAAGPITWTVDQKVVEPFNTLLNAKVSMSHKGVSLWIKGNNLTNSNRMAFLFRSLGRTLVQSVLPARFEVGVTIL